MTSTHSAYIKPKPQPAPRLLAYSNAVRKIQRVERETLQKYLLRRAA